MVEILRMPKLLLKLVDATVETITGTNADELISGKAGSDTIDASGGNDTIAYLIKMMQVLMVE